MLQLNKNKHYEWRNVWTLGNVVSYVYIIRQYQCDKISWEFMVNRMSQRKILVLKERSKIISILLSREVSYFFNVQLENKAQIGRSLVIVIGEVLKNLGLFMTQMYGSWAGGSLTCHTCCVLGPRFLQFHPKDCPNYVALYDPQLVLGPILTRNSTWVYWRSLNQRIKRENRCISAGVTWESIMHSINIC